VRPDLEHTLVVRVRGPHGHLERIEWWVIHGDPVPIRASLIVSGARSVDTSHVEREDLYVRRAAKRFVGETICFSKDGSYLDSYLETLQVWYNLMQPNRGLTIRTRGAADVHGTPPMAEGPANRPTTWGEILRWRRNLWD
jgi:hypothetical protein